MSLSELMETFQEYRSMLLLLIPILILQLILFISAIISIIRKKDVLTVNKVIWILIVVCISIIGPVIYFVVGSRMLDESIVNNDDEYYTEKDEK